MRIIFFVLCYFILMPVQAEDANFDDFDFDDVIEQIAAEEEPSIAQPTVESAPPVLVTAEALQHMIEAQKSKKYEQWAQVVREQSSNQMNIVIILCMVSVISLLAMLYVLKDRDSRDIVSGIGLNLIIFGTIIMVIVAETDQQLTAGAGILGAVAGYLFRSIQNDERPTNLDSSPPKQ